MIKKSLAFLLFFVLLFCALFKVPFTAANSIENDYVEVKTIEDLYMINSNLSGNYKLINDIDLTEATAEGGDWDFGGRGWEPIGSNGNYGKQPFTGVFDGNGHEIKGMRIDVISEYSGMQSNLPSTVTDVNEIYLGLFSSNSGTIRNLTVSGNINGYGFLRFAGGIVAHNEGGTIERCVNKCNMTLTYASNYGHYWSGIAGISKGGLISECYNTGSISIKDKGGSGWNYVSGITYTGLIGDDWCTITNCYNSGNLSANNSYYYYADHSHAYGIAKNGTILNCYNVGTLNAYNSYAISNVSTTDCYFLNGTGEEVIGAKPLTQAQMKLQMMYKGFSFDDVWIVDSNSDYPYPQLWNNPVQPFSLENATIALAEENFIYNSKEIKPRTIVKYGTKELIENKDYILEYLDNINVGNATVRIIGNGFFIDTLETSFSIEHKPIDGFLVIPEYTTIEYSGGAKEPRVTVTDGTLTLSNDDFTISYHKNINVGTAEVTVMGKGNYSGSSTGVFNITAKALADEYVFLETTEVSYNGREHTPLITVKNGNNVLVVNDDYLVSYENNLAVGKATVKVEGMNNYSGLVIRTFNIKYALGDVDVDGEITIFDATAIQRYLAALPVESFFSEFADTDGDGGLSILDATYIQRWLAGLSSNENIGKPIT